MAASIPRLLILLLFLLSFSLTFSNGRHFLLIVDSDDPDNKSQEDPDQSTFTDPSSDDFDEFGEPDVKPDSLLDPGSWKLILDPSTPFASNLSSSDAHDYDAVYFSAIRKLISASTTGDRNSSTESVAEISALSDSGHPHAQSAMGFFCNYGVRVERSAAKAFTYHHFAAGGGNLQSKMALAYAYYRQEMFEKAVELYGELARAAVASFLVSKDSPAVEQVRINDGTEENKDALRKLRGEDDDDFQITEYQAYKGNALAMYKLGVIYYFGLRGVQPDQTKALAWLLKAVEKGEPNSMELLGEMYVRGAGVERNYTKALEWLRLAAKQRLVSAYNGIGYLYLKGYGVEAKNLTKAREFFERAARHEDPSGNYNLGVMYLKGIGVKKDVKLASHHFVEAANFGQPKAFYQLAKMFQKGVGVKKDMNMAASFYKMVAERGPWGSLSRWALESYLKGDIGKAYLLYSRLAEMGYEFAQSSAAWILDKYGERSLCIGVSGFCTSTERHQRAHTLWWQASEQGNEHAALLIGDAYYYGRGTERDYDRAAEAYMHAHSKFNAQAMFNLGYMHEHGQGLPFDLHLAKRYYDQALEKEPAAKLAVTLALFSIWIRKNYSNTILVELLDALPGICYKIGASIERTVKDEGNATIFTLFVALITVLYFRDRQRRQAPVVQAPQPEMAGI